MWTSLLWFLAQSEDTFGVELQVTGMKSAAVAKEIAAAASKITGVTSAEAAFDDSLIKIRHSAGVSFKPKEFEAAVGNKGKLKDIKLVEIPGKVKRKGKELLFTSSAGVEYLLEQSDPGGVMGVEEQMPFIEKKVDEGKPGFLITGRLKVERTVDKKTKKETESYRIDIRRARWVSED